MPGPRMHVKCSPSAPQVAGIVFSRFVIPQSPIKQDYGIWRAQLEGSMRAILDQGVLGRREGSTQEKEKAKRVVERVMLFSQFSSSTSQLT